MKSRPLIGVGVIIVKAGHLLLLERRSVHGAGTWSTPGGHLEFGESPAACAIREVEEETGVVIRNVSFMGITNDIFAEAARHYVTLWMRGQYRSGTPSIRAPYEMSAVDWFKLDNLPQPLFLSLQNLVDGNSHPPSAWKDTGSNR
ncbi:MAG: NUDIX domain-containing protein [Desulfobacterales bacterium]|nr:NUDIX domain-containing protein [Desulfobacterales bacterium]